MKIPKELEYFFEYKNYDYENPFQIKIILLKDPRKKRLLFKKTDKSVGEIISLLNKISEKNFNVIVEKMNDLNFEDLELLDKFVDLVFLKSIKEPFYGKIFSKLCHIVGNFNISFRKKILERCEKEFVDIKCDDDLDSDKRYFLFNLVVFIGNLYLKNMISQVEINNYLENFLYIISNNSIECFSKLWKVVNKKIMNKKKWIDKIVKIYRDDKLISKRSKFMLLDIIEEKCS
jgi:hypothetical protein